MKPIRSFFLTIILSVLTLQLSVSQVSVGNVLPGQVDYTAFDLRQPEKIKISGQNGIYADDWRVIIYYGWIINTQTRKVVWHQIDKMSQMRELDYGEFQVEEELSLDKGSYELYFTGAYAPMNNYWNNQGFFNYFFADKGKGDITSKLPGTFYSRSRVKFRPSLNEVLGLSIKGQNVVSSNIDQLFSSKVSDAIVSITKPNHNSNIKNGFSLSASTSLNIYALGEGRKDEQFDYAWIYDVDKYNRVWEMDYRNTDFAGGADKNLKVSESITLPAGNYIVNYVSDDSHGYDDWNSMPPDDPQFYGITIWAKSDQDKRNVIPFKKSEEVKPVLAINQVGDREFIAQGLKVKAPLEIRLLCLGEFTSEMADGGWIINASNRNVVWDMNDAVLQHAGGASKNKMFDGKIKLDKGDYIVYYTTDDSHSYRDWNSGPPHEQDYWGITLWATKSEDLSKVELFSPEKFKSDKVIAEILQVRDDQYLNESFELKADSKLRIIAIGEGSDGDLFDYGWIKNNDTGKIVWEMTYRTTEHAGGAQKNRMFNDVIMLPKGSYNLYFETDDSHSYRDWNASPPREPEMYGISVQLEDN